MAVVAVLELSIIAAMLFALEWSNPGFLPVVCSAPESVAECASGPVAVTMVLLAALFLLALHSRRALTACQRTARDEATRKHEIAWELMAMRNSAMHSNESVRVGRSFKPQPSDVFVVTYPKCGTTWVTQILHALRTAGSMDFGEITEVVPWDILAHDCGQSLDAAQVATPRLFKSHESASDVAKGARYVYVARNPLDAFVSFHRFLPAYTGLQPGDITAEQFAEAIFAGASHSGQIWDHMRGWWERRDDPNVLWLFFEDLAEDLPRSVARIAAWMGVPCDAPLLERVCALASFEFMSAEANAHHFDDHFVRDHVGPKMGLRPGQKSAVSKVRTGGGKTGSRAALPATVTARLDAKWAAQLAPATGCADYEELRASMTAYLARPGPAPSGSAAGGSAAASVPARRAAKSPARQR